jgi:hypothetical protein
MHKIFKDREGKYKGVTDNTEITFALSRWKNKAGRVAKMVEPLPSKHHQKNKYHQGGKTVLDRNTEKD